MIIPGEPAGLPDGNHIVLVVEAQGIELKKLDPKLCHRHVVAGFPRPQFLHRTLVVGSG